MWMIVYEYNLIILKHPIANCGSTHWPQYEPKNPLLQWKRHPLTTNILVAVLTEHRETRLKPPQIYDVDQHRFTKAEAFD